MMTNSPSADHLTKSDMSVNAIAGKSPRMIVTFADGSRFQQLMDGTMLDDTGSEITPENCPDHYADMVVTCTPNAIMIPFAI